ncbi:hypothetical protein OK344_03215 [Kaistella sp. BT6-1-3]|uniref:Uncharacterized protein n=1 Tax=Kaistella yananensis TaxID=2989820 RepID=A0ABT3JKC5_9FLAO|nr:hypothetical protein [Kaistella yananensis]MCW4451210.1 hypothetical protein [Kaistella yananensis]
MKIFKILNIIFLLATIYQFYNFKIIYKYSISDEKLNTEYYYKEGRITKKEYEKELSDIEKEKKKIILYEKINQFLLILNILFFLYWVYVWINKKQ